MTRLLAQSIVVHHSPHGNLLSFDWLETRHYIKRIIQQWEIDTSWWEPAERIWRSYYALVTDSNLLLVIYEDLETAQWFVSRLYD